MVQDHTYSEINRRKNLISSEMINGLIVAAVINVFKYYSSPFTTLLCFQSVFFETEKIFTKLTN
jgi:hypothetical protein